MPSYTQANQPLAIDTPLGPDKLLLARLEGVEAVSDLFRFTLDCLAPEPVSFDDLLGKPATARLTIPGCPRRYVNGIVSSLEQGHQLQGPAGDVTFYRYRVELVPRMWLCGLRRQSRVFQETAVPDILRTVLQGDWGLPIQWRLSGTYPARDYCVQYRETDLAFARRLMEEEGICFYFSHTQNGHTLLLADSPDGHDGLPGQGTLLFDAATGGRRPEGRVTAWSKRQTLRSCKVTLRDHCFQLPDSTLQASATIPESVTSGTKQHRLQHSVTKGGEELLEYYDHLGGYSWRFDGVAPDGSNQPEKVQGLYKENQRVTDLRAEAEATQALSIDGASLCGHLLPGYKFTLQRHFDGDGGYLLTRVEHRADLEAAYLSDNAPAGLLYENRFAASPASMPFRPPLETPRPRTYGALNALVMGPKGGDIFVDKYGRVKVKFFWDREEATGPRNSCWLRVGQLWAGNRWGAFFWPRVGHEVIVSFIDGNPDRPIITGSVYNENHMPPFELPGNKALAGVKSNTSSAGGKESDPLVNYSGWLINDEPGQEHIEIHGERHIAFFGEQSHRHTVDGWHRLNVNGTHSVHVGGFPGGSGSGGGWVTDTTDPPFIYFGETGSGQIGVQFGSVCGVNAAITLGLFAEMTVGDYFNLICNPVGILADLGFGTGSVTGPLTGLLGMAGAAFGGNINMVLGSNTAINYGQSITINRGGKAAITESTNWKDSSASPAAVTWSAVAEGMALLISSLSVAGTLGLSLNSYDKHQDTYITLEGSVGILSTATVLVESLIAMMNQVYAAEKAAQAEVLGQSVPAMTDTASVLVSLVKPSTTGLNKGKYVQGTTAEFNGATRIIGATDATMLFGGTVEEEQTVVSLTPDMLTLAAGVPLVGGRIQIDADGVGLYAGPSLAPPNAVVSLEPGQISLSTLPDTSITLEPGVIKLTAGECSITLSAVAGITLTTGAVTVALTAAGMLTVEAEDGIQLLSATNLDMAADTATWLLPTLDIDTESNLFA